MFEVIAQISFGLAVGVITTLIKPDRNTGGHLAAASIGLIGSLSGTLAGRALFGTESKLAGWVASVLGALLVLSIYRVFFGSRTAY